MTNTCLVNGYHASFRRHPSVERNSSFCDFCVSYLVSTEFSEGTDVDVKQDFVKMSDIELADGYGTVVR